MHHHRPGADPDGANEFALLFNGSNPIFVRNVDFLNIATAGGNDNVVIDPYANNITGGWGIHVTVDGGAGTDTVAVSRGIVGGFGVAGYYLALRGLRDMLAK